MSWEPGSRLQYGQPMRFENVAADFRKLRIVLAHLAWPWVTEAVALALKYRNVYLDTSALYFDNPRDFLRYAMTQQVPLTVFERSLRHQLLFGSNYPRVEIKNMARAVRGARLLGRVPATWCSRQRQDAARRGGSMIFKLERIEVQSRKDMEMIDITAEVDRVVAESGLLNGVVLAMTVPHLVGTARDRRHRVPGARRAGAPRAPRAQGAARRRAYGYWHNRYLDFDGRLGFNAGDHLKSILGGVNCFFPIENGKVIRGSRQRVYFVEYDGPLARTVFIQVLGEGR